MPFLQGDYYETAKIHRQNFKIFSCITGPISTKIGTTRVNGTHGFTNKDDLILKKGDNGVSLFYQPYYIIITMRLQTCLLI